jgi:hypothetical protein
VLLQGLTFEGISSMSLEDDQQPPAPSRALHPPGTPPPTSASSTELQAPQPAGGQGAGGVRLPTVGREAVERVMALLWDHLEEPLAQTVKQVQEAFETLLAILAAQEYYAGAAGGACPPAM